LQWDGCPPSKDKLPRSEKFASEIFLLRLVCGLAAARKEVVALAGQSGYQTEADQRVRPDSRRLSGSALRRAGMREADIKHL
jgi:hypothetical protein